MNWIIYGVILMSDIYIPDCSQCKDKKGCCNPSCVERLTKKKQAERDIDKRIAELKKKLEEMA